MHHQGSLPTPRLFARKADTPRPPEIGVLPFFQERPVHAAHDMLVLVQLPELTTALDPREETAHGLTFFNIDYP